MTHKETVERNIGLTFDFVNYLIENKAELEKLPENFTLEFMEKDFPTIEHKIPSQATLPTVNRKYVRVKNSFEFTM